MRSVLKKSNFNTVFNTFKKTAPKSQRLAFSTTKVVSNEPKGEKADYEIFKKMQQVNSLEDELYTQRAEERMKRSNTASYSGEFKLITKKPTDSKVTVLLEFSKDKKLRRSYLTTAGGIRMGRILEDLDSLAGEIAYKHADGFHPERPVTIVTASVDRIEMHEPLIPYFDVKLEGFVTCVGKSSMEVRIDVTTLTDEGEKHVLVAYFTMVAREKYGNKSAEVHGIEPQTEREKHLHELAQENKARRTKHNEQSLQKVPPTAEELQMIHSMYLRLKQMSSEFDFSSQLFGSHSSATGSIDTDSLKYLRDFQSFRYMASTNVYSTRLMHPQQRNIHNKIFGGYLLRQAYELAFICVQLFSKNRPVFISLDENSFLKPVEIGSILNLSAKIVYTTKGTCQVQVEAKVIHPSLGTAEVTNVFYFSFAVPVQHAVIPKTYEEVIDFLQGGRVYSKAQAATELLLKRRLSGLQ